MQVAPIQRVEAVRIDLQPLQRTGRALPVDRIALCLGKVAHPAQKPQRNPRRAPRAGGNLHRAFFRDLSAELARRRHDDAAQLFGLIEFQPHRNAEPVAQWRRQQACTRGGTDQRKGRQVQPHGTGRWPLPDHDVEGIVLHRGIEDLLHDRRQAVDFVNEQNIVRLKICQDRGEVARFRNHRAGGCAEADAHLAGQDLRQRRLAEARRAEQENMVQRLSPPARSLDIDFQVRLRLALADIILKRLGTERPVQRVTALRVRIREFTLAAHGRNTGLSLFGFGTFTRYARLRFVV